jgi:hypothetical protein
MLLLILISVVNSVFLTLAIWAGLQLPHTDWWVVLSVIFIMGTLYEVEYSKFTGSHQLLIPTNCPRVRRNILRTDSQDDEHVEFELVELPRPPLAHMRSTRRPDTSPR